MTKYLNRTLLLAAAGLAAGLVNGLLGAGGGIIAVLAFNKLLESGGVDRRDSFANAIAVMLPCSAVSAISYGMRGVADSRELGILVLPAILGGLCGALILDRINIRWLKIIFSSIIIYSGINMLLK